jgi:hypothetical protein
MPLSAQTFRVFVSSTFSDLKAERNALQAEVFPGLREFSAARGARFQAIDLPWGIRSTHPGKRAPAHGGGKR